VPQLFRVLKLTSRAQQQIRNRKPRRAFSLSARLKTVITLCPGAERTEDAADLIELRMRQHFARDVAALKQRLAQAAACGDLLSDLIGL